MSEENRKIVIVIGAGASCDFVVPNFVESDQNHGKQLYEIWDNLDYKSKHVTGGYFYYRGDPRKYFIVEKFTGNFSFPSGEALIKLIASQGKIFDLFRNEILEGIYQDFCKKVDLSLENQDREIADLKKDYLKYFFKFLKLEDEYFNIKNGKHEKFLEEELIDLLKNFYQSYLERKNHVMKNYVETDQNFMDFLNKLEFENKKIDSSQVGSSKYFEELNCFLINLFNIQEKIKSFDFILQATTSPYLFISKLVNHYQPFSIDELLDSINRNKIDYLKPLGFDIAKLKNILKDSENKTDEEFKNEFKNTLIKAGKTLIALFLFRSEKLELFKNFDAKIWYRHIRNLIISGKDEEEINKNIENLTIISFNYDRSLDYYLRTRLEKYYDKIEKRIFYPYGKLAVDNWDCDDYGKYNKYEKISPYEIEDFKKIKISGEALRVIGELDEDLSKKYPNLENKNLTKYDKYKNNISDFEQYCQYCRDIKRDKPLNVLILEISELEELKKSENDAKIKDEINFILEKYKTLFALHESHKIYFLGFAFHQQNCDLLQLKNFRQNKEIYWTNYDASVAIDNKVNEIYGSQDKKNFYPSNKKGVYEALIHDFRLDFNSKFPSPIMSF